jgi:uncharacterized protein YciI
VIDEAAQRLRRRPSGWEYEVQRARGRFVLWQHLNQSPGREIVRQDQIGLQHDAVPRQRCLPQRHLAAHVVYLKTLVAAGSLRASGPLKGTRLRSGFLIFMVPDRATVEALVAADPFATKGLIESLTITEWDPLFGAFAAESSGNLAGLSAAEI